MNINESINALHNISADFNRIPGRINKVFSSMDSQNEAPPPTEGLENIMTDLLVGENAFTANVKAIRHMNTVEDILLNELRKQD